MYILMVYILIWQYLRDSPNCQIKATAKYTTYTVYPQVDIRILVSKNQALQILALSFIIIIYDVMIQY